MYRLHIKMYPLITLGSKTLLDRLNRLIFHKFSFMLQRDSTDQIPSTNMGPTAANNGQQI